MPKLYPPQIEGTIPAATGDIINVPFVMNRAVGWNEISGFILKIKTVESNEVVGNFITEYSINNISTTSMVDKDRSIVSFNIKDANLTIGSFYKIQMAYRSSDEDKTIGYFSTVGIIKYTAKPKVYISNLENNILNLNQGSFVGVYDQSKRDDQESDLTEKIYSYEFNIYDLYGSLIETSGKLLHNHENNTELDKMSDTYTLQSALAPNEVYFIEFLGTTINGLEFISNKYRITEQTLVNATYEPTLIPTLNEENGYIELQIIGKMDNRGIEQSNVVGNFLISRSSSENNFSSWEVLDRFTLLGDSFSNYKWKDFTIAHGKEYRYSVQQYNGYGVYSKRYYSDIIKVYFEHSFLYDGDKQLKIKYNPKITNFKDTLLESKVNTMGGQYPYFFKNGNVQYKEFSISGLISYWSDEEELFLTNSELGLDELSKLQRPSDNSFNEFDRKIISQSKNRTTNLTNYNILAERIFKMKVLNFLNDGKPKLFKSPTEGNYIVRLMNSSLSPNEQLGRMLHTFSTTASEIAEYNYKNLGKYDLTKIKEPNTVQLKWHTVKVADILKLEQERIQKEKEKFGEELIEVDGQFFYYIDNEKVSYINKKWILLKRINNIYSIECLDMMPGDKIKIKYNEEDEGEEIVIGVTGAYAARFDKALYSVEIFYQNKPQGQITYSFYNLSTCVFDLYKKIIPDDIPLKQFIGEYKQDIKETLQDEKYEITNYYFLQATKRTLIDLIYKDSKLYLANSKILGFSQENNMDELTEKQLKNLNKLYIYKIYNPNPRDKNEEEYYYFYGEKEFPLKNNIIKTELEKVEKDAGYLTVYYDQDLGKFYYKRETSITGLEDSEIYISSKEILYQIEKDGEYYYSWNPFCSEYDMQLIGNIDFDEKNILNLVIKQNTIYYENDYFNNKENSVKKNLNEENKLCNITLLSDENDKIINSYYWTKDESSFENISQMKIIKIKQENQDRFYFEDIREFIDSQIEIGENSNFRIFIINPEEEEEKGYLFPPNGTQLSEKMYYDKEKGFLQEQYKVDFNNLNTIAPSYKIYIDNNSFDLEETNDLNLDNLGYLPSITTDNGVVLNLSIQRKEMLYNFEDGEDNDDNKQVVEAKNKYLEAEQELNNLLYGSIGEIGFNEVFENNYEIELERRKRKTDKFYREYLEMVKKILLEKEFDLEGGN